MHSPRPDWKVSIYLSLLTIISIIIAFSIETHVFGRHDPSNRRAYAFGVTMSTLAALAIGFGIRSIEARTNRPASLIGIILGTLSLLASAAFLLGTILPGD